MHDLFIEIARAEQRIRPYIRETPLEPSAVFGEAIGGNVLLKLENLQLTGSFKVRGALNRLLALEPQRRARGVIAASSGNHGAGVAYAAKTLGIPATIYVPEDVSPTKLAAMRRLGAEVVLHGDDCLISEGAARAAAETRGVTYVSPYNDIQVAAGQGTIGVELARQCANADAVFVAVGGGGLISGIAAYLKTLSPAITIYGCSPVNSAVMAHSVAAGRLLELESLPTISDGTAGGVEADAITFDWCRALIDHFVLVEEAEIRAAMRLFLETHHMLIEGAAGVALAALLRMRDELRGRRVVVVLCGANLSLAHLRSVIGVDDHS